MDTIVGKIWHSCSCTCYDMISLPHPTRVFIAGADFGLPADGFCANPGLYGILDLFWVLSPNHHRILPVHIWITVRVQACIVCDLVCHHANLVLGFVSIPTVDTKASCLHFGLWARACPMTNCQAVRKAVGHSAKDQGVPQR